MSKAKDLEHRTARQIDRLMGKYSLTDIEALDVLEIMNTNRIGEIEAVSRYRLSQEDSFLYGKEPLPTIFGIDPTQIYQQGDEIDPAYQELSIVSDPNYSLDLESDEIESERWLLTHEYSFPTTRNWGNKRNNA